MSHRGAEVAAGPTGEQCGDPEEEHPQVLQKERSPLTPRCPRSKIHIRLLQTVERVNLCSFVIPAVRNENR